MKLLKIICLLTIISVKLSCARNLTCADFKTGNFYMPIANASEKHSTVIFDSIHREPLEVVVDRDSTRENIAIIRNNNSQTEWIDGFGNGTPEYEIIEWIDECNYRLKTDGTKMELDEEDSEMNKNGGLLIEKIGIEGRCLEYKATMTTTEGHKIIQFGLICKE